MFALTHLKKSEALCYVTESGFFSSYALPPFFLASVNVWLDSSAGLKR